jgi:chemotaxis protein MotB
LGRSKQQEPDRPSIVVLYTSLMILLLAFFILLNAFSTTEETRLIKAVKSVGDAFGVSKGSVSPLRLGYSQSGSSFKSPINPVEQDYLALRGLAAELDVSDDVKLLRSQSKKTLVLTDALLFQPGSTELGEQGEDFLLRVAEVIRGRTYPVSVKGHTDEKDGIDLGGENNWRLSAERALTVVRFLASKGVDPTRLAAFGLAGYRPMVAKSNPNHLRLNNRVELVFDAKDSSFYQLPEGKAQRRLDFKGFTFDLFKEEDKD